MRPTHPIPPIRALLFVLILLGAIPAQARVLSLDGWSVNVPERCAGASIHGLQSYLVQHQTR